MKHATRNKIGFTLIELLVGVAVFSLAIVIAVSLFATALRNQRKSIAIQNVQDNARYLISFMAKEIRMSEIRALDDEVFVLDITHPIDGDITYIFTGTDITRNGERINSNQVQINGRFFVDGKTGGDDEQPRVTIVVKTKTTGVKIEEQAEINLQTTLSQRRLD